MSKPRATWKGSLSFGLLNVPIELYTSATEDKLRFRTIDPSTNNPIRSVYLNDIGEEVSRSETLSRHVFEDGVEVTFHKDELHGVQPKKSREMKLEGFCFADEVSPKLHRTTSLLGPQGDEAVNGFRLLTHGLIESGRVGYGTYVQKGSERLFIVRPEVNADGVQLFLHELYWPNEVREPYPVELGHLDSGEADAAMTLIESLARPFEHEGFASTYKPAVLEVLRRKAEGLVVDEELPYEDPKPTSDIMSALLASIDQAKKAA